jgi:hypothetical protein
MHIVSMCGLLSYCYKRICISIQGPVYHVIGRMAQNMHVVYVE